jgi:hypothetical protein
MLQPKYTMHGFSWYDLRGTEGVGFERAVRTLLTNFLPTILPELSHLVKVRFDQLRQEHTSLDVKGQPQHRVFSMMKKLVAVANAYALFGTELCNNEEFMEAASTFMDQTLTVAEIIRLVPSFTVPFIGKMTSTFFQSDRKMYQTLLALVEQRCAERDMKAMGQKVPQHVSSTNVYIRIPGGEAYPTLV